MKLKIFILTNAVMVMMFGAIGAWAAKDSGQQPAPEALPSGAAESAQSQTKILPLSESRDQMLDRIDSEIKALVDACGQAAVDDFDQQVHNDSDAGNDDAVLIFASDDTLWFEVDGGAINAEFSGDARDSSDGQATGRFKNQDLEFELLYVDLDNRARRRLTQQIKRCLKESLDAYRENFTSTCDAWVIGSVRIQANVRNQ